MAFLTQTSGVDALHAETARRLVDKLQDVLKRFQKCLVLGGAGVLPWSVCLLAYALLQQNPMQCSAHVCTMYSHSLCI
jgi:hypothetical protein